MNSNDYIDLAKKLKLQHVLQHRNLKNIYLKTCLTIVVKNVLLSIAEVSKKFYPDADIDYPDQTLIEIKKHSSKISTLLHLVRIFLLEKM